MDTSQSSTASSQQLPDSQTTTTSTSSNQNSASHTEKGHGCNLREMHVPPNTKSGSEHNPSQISQSTSVSGESAVRHRAASGDSSGVDSRQGALNEHASAPLPAAVASNSNHSERSNGEKVQTVPGGVSRIPPGDPSLSSVTSGRPPKPQQPPVANTQQPQRTAPSSAQSNQTGSQSPQKSQPQPQNASPQMTPMSAESATTAMAPSQQSGPLPDNQTQPTPDASVAAAPSTPQTTISSSATVSNVGIVGSTSVVQMQPGTSVQIPPGTRVVTKKKGRFNIIQHVPATAITPEVTVTTGPVITTGATTTTAAQSIPTDGAPPPPPEPGISPEFSNAAKSNSTPSSATNSPAPAPPSTTPTVPVPDTTPVVKKKGRFVITSVTDPNTQMVPIALTTAPTVIATIPTSKSGEVAANGTVGGSDQQLGQQQQQSQQLVYARPTQVMMTGVMPTQQVVYTTASSSPPVNQSSSLASPSTCVTEENSNAHNTKAVAGSNPQHRRNNSDGGSATQNISDQKPSTNSTKSMSSNRNKQNLSSLDGLHKVFYFLDQMKTEVVDADKTIKCLQADIKSLQNDMKFLKEKNKELEAKARDSERKLVDERRIRESTEGKLKTLRNKMRELKEEGVLPVMKSKVDARDNVGQESKSEIETKSIGISPSKRKVDSSDGQKNEKNSISQPSTSASIPKNETLSTEAPLGRVSSSGSQPTNIKTSAATPAPKTNDSTRISAQMSNADPLPAMTPPRDTPLVHHKNVSLNGPPPLPATGSRGVNRTTSAIVLGSSKQAPVVVPQSSKSYSGKTGEALGKQAAAISKTQSSVLNTTQPKTTPQDFDPLRPENTSKNVPHDVTHNGSTPVGPAPDFGNGLHHQAQYKDTQQQHQTFQQAQFPVLMMDQQMAYPIVVEGTDYMTMQTQPFVQMQPQQTLLSTTPDGMTAQQQTILQMQPQQAMYGTPMNSMPVQNGSSYQDFPAQGMFLLQQPEVSHQNAQMMTFQQPVFQFQGNLADPSQVAHLQQSPQIEENKVFSARQHLARNRSVSVNDFDPLQQSGPEPAQQNAAASASPVDPFDELVNRK